MTVDLVGEIAIAHRNLTRVIRDNLIGAGADPGIVAAMLGALPAAIEGRLWQPLASAPEVIVLPVFADDIGSPETDCPALAYQYGDLIDLIAFDITTPDRWALRIGSAAWLGHFGPQYLNPPPVEVHSTPWDWVCSSGRGIVPLTKTPSDMSLLFAQCRALSVADVAQGRAIKRALERPFPTPRILVRQHRAKEAAA